MTHYIFQVMRFNYVLLRRKRATYIMIVTKRPSKTHHHKTFTQRDDSPSKAIYSRTVSALGPTTFRLAVSRERYQCAIQPANGCYRLGKPNGAVTAIR